jgi:hypothetical protein
MPVTDRNVRNLSAWVESALESLVDGIGQRLREDVPEFFEDEGAPHLHANRQAIRANLAAVADGLEDGRRVPEDVPAGAIEEALMSARNGIAWSVLGGRRVRTLRLAATGLPVLLRLRRRRHRFTREGVRR